LTTPALNADTSADIDRRSDTQPMVDNILLESAVVQLRLMLLRFEMVIVRCCEILKYSWKWFSEEKFMRNELANND
jgi:hypothetical protein